MQREYEWEESKTRSRLANWAARMITTAINYDCSGMVREDNSSWISYVSAYLISEAPTALCSRLYLQGPLHIHQPWKRVPLSRAKGRFCDSRKEEDRTGMVTAHYKMFGFPEFKVPLRQHSSLYAGVFWLSLHYPVVSGEWHKNAYTLTLAIAVSNKLSFVFDLWDHVFHQHSWHWWAWLFTYN